MRRERCCSLPPQLVRLLTLLTLLLADASFFGVVFAAYLHSLQPSETFSVIALLATGVGVTAYVAFCAWAAIASSRGAAHIVIREARRGRVPGTSSAEELRRYLQGEELRGLAVPPQQRVPPRRAAGVDGNVARDPERALCTFCTVIGPPALAAFQAVVRRHALATCKPQHSVPLLRLMMYGWQPSIEPWAFAGMLRASFVWGLLVGAPAGGLSCYVGATRVIATQPPRDQPLGEDSSGDYTWALLAVGAVCVLSLIVSAAQLASGLPSQLLELTQRESAHLESVIRAEFRAAAGEAMLARQLDRKVEATLQLAGSAVAALPEVKRLEKAMVDEKLRCVRALADNPDFAPAADFEA